MFTFSKPAPEFASASASAFQHKFQLPGWTYSVAEAEDGFIFAARNIETFAEFEHKYTIRDLRELNGVLDFKRDTEKKIFSTCANEIKILDANSIVLVWKIVWLLGKEDVCIPLNRKRHIGDTSITIELREAIHVMADKIAMLERQLALSRSASPTSPTSPTSPPSSPPSSSPPSSSPLSSPPPSSPPSSSPLSSPPSSSPLSTLSIILSHKPIRDLILQQTVAHPEIIPDIIAAGVDVNQPPVM